MKKRLKYSQTSSPPEMKSKSKIPEEEKLAILPPCAICSAKSSGLHFGVNTCEACKAFFRRCLNRRKETPLSCLGAGDCVIDISVKTLCSACRYEKCLKNGMSKSAIKTGRYSMERKADLIKDVIAKKGTVSGGAAFEEGATSSLATSSSNDDMEMDISVNPISNTEQNFPNNYGAVGDNLPYSDATQLHPMQTHHNSFSLDQTVSMEEPIMSLEVKKVKKVSSPALAAILRSTSYVCNAPYSANNAPVLADLQPFQSHHPTHDAQIPSYLPLTPASSPRELNGLSPSHIISPNGANAGHIPETKSGTTSTEVAVTTTQELDHIIQQVAAAYELYCPYTEEVKAKIVENQAQYKEEQEFFTDLFGPMKPLALEEYMEIYSNTGIDVDGRRELATKFVGHIDQMIQRLIGFAKCIPGFTDINIDDQIALIRGGSIDWLIITSTSGVNVESNIITSFFGLTLSRDELMKVHGKEIPDAVFTMSKLIQEMALDDTALALMAAVCIADPEQLVFHLKNKDEVVSVQYNIMEALHLYLSRTCERHLLVFNRAMAILKELRKERIRIHYERIRTNGVCFKMGVMATPLMNAIMEENEQDNREHPLMQAVINDDEARQGTSHNECDTQHMQS